MKRPTPNVIQARKEPLTVLCKAKVAVSSTKCKAIGQSHINLSRLRVLRRIVASKPVSQTFQVDSRRHSILSPVSKLYRITQDVKASTTNLMNRKHTN